jgi:glycosyltransferase involved in cell wall biosynthesis
MSFVPTRCESTEHGTLAEHVGPGSQVRIVELNIPEVSVVVPVYRNAATLQELHQRLLLALPAAHELIFVNDSCPEGSDAALSALARSDGRVGAIHLQLNHGQHRAVLLGLSYARAARVVILDADLQDPPEAIPLLLSTLESDPRASAVFAGRRMVYQSSGRMLTSQIFKTLLHRLSGGRLPPDAGLFVVMKRKMVTAICRLQGADSHVLALMARSHLEMRSIPVDRSVRQDGASAYSGWRRLTVAWHALRTLWSPPRSVLTPNLRLEGRVFEAALRPE